MIIYIEKQISIYDRIFCDVCGKEFESVLETQEFQYIRFTGGYASIFGDGAKIECDICQHCLKSMIEKYYREVE